MGTKQSAVEFAVNKLANLIPSGNQIVIRAILIEAKEMEKQQQGFSEEDLEVAYFEGQFGKYSFNDWFEQFKNK